MIDTGASGVSGRILFVALCLFWSQDSPSVESDQPANAATPYKAEHPGFEQAQLAARSGDFEFALAEYARLLTVEPDNVDYLFGYAQVLFWMKQPRRSLPFIQQARKLSPDYEDVWALEWQVRHALDSAEYGSETDAFVREARERFPNSEWHRKPVEPNTVKTHWELGATREHLSNGSPDWQSTNARLTRDLSDDASISLAYGRYKRFGESDTEYGGDLRFRVARVWTVFSGIRTSSSPVFLPESEAGLQITRQFRHGWVSSVKMRRRDYDDVLVTSVGMTLDKYVGRYRLAYGLERSHLSSEQALVNTLSANYFTSHDAQFGLVLAAGQEIQVVGVGQLMKIDVNAVVLSARHSISDRLYIAWQIGTHKQGNLYRRNLIGISLTGGF
jgi:YaiO family outer membrane protein